MLADLVGAGTEMVVAQGGRGGLGNAALASAKRKAPGFALLGEPGDDRVVDLELKVVADVGLVGFPSAGKSSLIAALSRARPKIADYPFTTLVPNLGVVKAGDTTFTVADVPGLIEGASEGRGLGHDFLRHIERCAAIVHVVDCATMEPGRDPVSDLDVIERELQRYGGLEDRPRLVALNKIDVPDGRDMADMVADDIEARGWQVFPVSASSHEGLRELIVRDGRASSPRAAAEAPAGRADPDRDPAAVARRRRRVHRQARPARAGGCAARSPSAGSGRPTSATTRPSASSPTGSTGSASRRELVELGAVEGDAVLIGDPDNAVVFDFEPGSTPARRCSAAAARTSASTSPAGRPPSPGDRRGHARPRRGRGPRRRGPPLDDAAHGDDSTSATTTRTTSERPGGGDRQPDASWSRSARRR